MDPAHLLTDELDYEFTIRELSPHEPNSIDRLRQRIQNEMQGARASPHGEQVVTRNGVGREFTKCEQKFIEISQAVTQAEEAADDSLSVRAQSRVIHVIGRIRRLQQRAPEDAANDRLLSRAEQLLRETDEARNSLGAGEASALVEGIKEGVDDLFSNADLRDQWELEYRNPGAIPPLQQSESRRQSLASNKGKSFDQLQSQRLSGFPPLSSEKRPQLLSLPATVPVQPSGNNGAIPRIRQSMLVTRDPLPQTNTAMDNQLQFNTHNIGTSQHQLTRQNAERSPQLVSGVLAAQFDSAAHPIGSNVRGFFNNMHAVNAQPSSSRRAGHQDDQQYMRDPAVSQAGPNTFYGNNRRGSGGHGAANYTGGHNIHKWNLRFDGHGPIDANDFVFRLERQAQLHGVAPQALVIGIVELLSGKAEQWYWMYQRRSPDATWDEFRRAFLERYGPNEDTDLEIRSNIENRWQRAQESFNDFCLDIEAMAARMLRPMPETELVEILRRNMLSNLHRALWQTQTRTIAGLLQQCNAYEKMMRDSRRRDRMRFPAQVNEMQMCEDDQYEDTDYGMMSQQQLQMPSHMQQQMRMPHQWQAQQTLNTQTQLPNTSAGYVEAVEPGYMVEAVETQRSANDLVICWNCKDIGHTFAQCPQPQRSIFCFSCGLKDVISINCPKCSLNSRRGRPQAEGTRYSLQNPPPQLMQRSTWNQNPTHANKFRTQNSVMQRQSPNAAFSTQPNPNVNPRNPSQ